MPHTPRPDRAAATPSAGTPTAVLAPITLVGPDASAAVIEAVEAAGAGATGIDLTILDGRFALERGVTVADTLADASGLAVFIRTDGPLSPGAHRRICPAGQIPSVRRPTAPCVIDIGIDRLDLPPDASELASHWPSDQDPGSSPFMISTLGFDSADDAEVVALATLAVIRGAVAITTDRIRSARRVVDTVTAVIQARGAG